MLEIRDFGSSAIILPMSPLNERREESLTKELYGKGKAVIEEESLSVKGNAFVKGEMENKWDLQQEKNRSIHKALTI